VAAPDGRQAPPVVARQPLAEVRRVVALPFAAAVPRAVLTSSAQVSEAPPSAASAGLHAARDAAARRRVVAALHVIAAKRTWEQPVAASRVAARQPLEPFGMATSTFGLGAQLAALVTMALQRRIVARPDRMRHRPARWSAAVEHRKPVPSPERLRHVLASTHQALVACPCCPAPAVR
jgi:hypothetical protein